MCFLLFYEIKLNTCVVIAYWLCTGVYGSVIEEKKTLRTTTTECLVFINRTQNTQSCFLMFYQGLVWKKYNLLVLNTCVENNLELILLFINLIFIFIFLQTPNGS